MTGLVTGEVCMIYTSPKYAYNLEIFMSEKFSFVISEIMEGTLREVCLWSPRLGIH